VTGRTGRTAGARSIRWTRAIRTIPSIPLTPSIPTVPSGASADGTLRTKLPPRSAPRLRRVAASVLALVGFAAGARALNAQADSAYLVAASQARVRVQPSPTAPELARLPVAAVVRPTRGAPDQGRATRWTAVTLADGRRGWASTDLLLPFDPAHPLAGYLALADRRLAREGGSFAEWSRLTGLMESAARMAPAGSDDAGRAALLRLLALQRSLGALGREKPAAMRYEAGDTDPWLRRYAKLIAFSEPAGEWFVSADELWRLRERHAGQRIAERIAWAAATQPIPGECEDDPECQFTLQEWTTVRYLALYPHAAHAPDALKQLADGLRSAGESATRQPFCRAGEKGAVTLARTAAMRRIIYRATTPGHSDALAALNRLAVRCLSAPAAHSHPTPREDT
jgi:hypothetical protein